MHAGKAAQPTIVLVQEQYPVLLLKILVKDVERYAIELSAEQRIHR
jgi:hypothetical protein